MRVFRRFLLTPGKMLCFFGPELNKHKGALQKLISRQMLVEEQFSGAYSLTPDGFRAMKAQTSKADENDGAPSKSSGKGSAHRPKSRKSLRS
jgi:hypothetical protein